MAQLNNPCGIAIDSTGFIYVTDRDNHRVCRVSPNGLLVTLAGSGSPGFSDGIGSFARFNRYFYIVSYYFFISRIFKEFSDILFLFYIN